MALQTARPSAYVEQLWYSQSFKPDLALPDPSVTSALTLEGPPFSWGKNTLVNGEKSEWRSGQGYFSPQEKTDWEACKSLMPF